jgi:hypothetical protein
MRPPLASLLSLPSSFREEPGVPVPLKTLRKWLSMCLKRSKGSEVRMTKSQRMVHGYQLQMQMLKWASEPTGENQMPPLDATMLLTSMTP